MNVLLVTEYYWPHVGGVEVVFKNLAEGIAKSGHRVTVVTSRLPKQKQREKVNGVNVERVAVPRWGDRYWFTLLSLTRLWKASRDADVIHATLYNAALPAWIVAKVRGKKCVLTVHEIFGARWSERFGVSFVWAWMHRGFERLLLALPFDRHVCVSHATAQDLSPYKDPCAVTVIHNGIDQNHFNPRRHDGKNIRTRWGIAPKEFLILYYGRPGISKGVEFLVRALPSIVKEIPRAKLVLILSQKPLKGYRKIRELIERMKEKDAIRLVDSVPYSELPACIKAANVVVVPSLAEGFGFAAAETSAMGVPVVISDAGSLPEVAHGTVAKVTAKSTEAIAAGVVAVHRGEAAQVPFKRFSWTLNVREHLKLYKCL